MKIVPVKTPRIAKELFPNYIWNINTNKKELYLTFDDGPTPEITDFVLEQLAAYNAKATFFCVGANVEKHPDIFNRIMVSGHAIGNHTQHHIKGWKTSTNGYLEDIASAEAFLRKATSKFQENVNSKVEGVNNKFHPETSEGHPIDMVDVSESLIGLNQNKTTNVKLTQNLRINTCRSEIINGGASIPKLFRPPYGQIKPNQGRRLMALGYRIILWDVLSFDWDSTVSEDKCLENVISKSQSGSIIVFHDSIKASRNMQYTLPRVLNSYTEKGFVFKALFEDNLNL